MASQEEAKVLEWFLRGYRHVKPDPDMTVSEWADANRILSAKASAEAGPWRTSRTPYLRDIMDALSASSPYETVVFMKGAQIGATEAGLNWIGYIIDINPKPVMIVWPTESSIKENVRIRLEPMIEACPTIKDKIGGKLGSKDSADNLFMKEFTGGYLAMAASNSSAALRSKPICYLMLDEVDEYPCDINQQGDPINLAIARTRTYSGKRKIYMPSTPTVVGNSRIEKAFNETDQRRYYVPCPFCGEYQTLEFRNLHYDPSNIRNVWYECAHCGGSIKNYHKSTMLEKGEWRAQKKAKFQTTIGFHLSSLYSPVGMFSWEELIEKWLKDKDDSLRLKEFYNTVLGEPYQEAGDLPEWEKLYMRREDYKFGSVPENVLFITAGADVQKDRIEYEVVGWGRNKESWSIDYQVLLGDTANLGDDCWRQLDMLMSREFQHEAGSVLRVRCLAIDSQYNTQTVLNWCRKYPGNKVIAVQGKASLDRIISQPTAVDVYTDNKRRKRAMQKYSVGVSVAKMELYGWLNMEKGDVGMENPPGYCHFPKYDEEYFKQLCSEQYVIKEVKITRNLVGEWRKIRERNEALDIRVYARAAAALLQMDNFKPEHWDQLERIINPNKREIHTEDNSKSQREIKNRARKPRYISKGVTLN